MHTAQLELVILIIWSTMQFKAFKWFFFIANSLGWKQLGANT